jgi:transposase
MPVKRVSMRQIQECLRLKFDCALSHEQIARALGLSKGAVTKYLQRASQVGLNWETAAALEESQLEARLSPARGQPMSRRVLPDWAVVHRELRRKGVTLQLLWEEYVEAHAGAATYRYTQFCHLYQGYAARLKRSMRQTHRAGEKLFIDYAGQTVPVIDRVTGEIRQAHIFVAVLGASNYTFACATARETQADWLSGLAKALKAFGGVPELVVPDNPKALITRPDRYEPGVSRMAQDCARHYGTAILPARPYHPQDKAKVEVGVQIVERWILARLRHRRFFSLGELNQAIAELLADLNQRPFKKLPGNRLSWFKAIDRPALRPLPVQPYDIAHFKRCRVNLDYHVEIDGHYYSVPHALVRQEVEARITQTTVEILHGGRRVASHPRCDRRGTHTTLAEHMPKSHRAHREWSPGRLLNWAERIGPHTKALVHHQLTHKPHPEMGYRACLGLLALARQYGEARLEAACERAVALGACNRHSVVSILQAGLDRQPLPPSTPQTDWISPDHDHVRGPDYYH